MNDLFQSIKGHTLIGLICEYRVYERTCLKLK